MHSNGPLLFYEFPEIFPLQKLQKPGILRLLGSVFSSMARFSLFQKPSLTEILILPKFAWGGEPSCILNYVNPWKLFANKKWPAHSCDFPAPKESSLPAAVPEAEKSTVTAPYEFFFPYEILTIH